MKLVAITRILNEDDIVEAFVRHHAAEIDHHLFLDKGSVDRTLEILRALKAEGFALTVLQSTTPFFNETDFNTGLFEHAVARLGADWALCLDTDEFVDTRRSGFRLRDHLASIPAAVDFLKIRSLNYFDMATDDARELLVPRRIRWRQRSVINSMPKVFLRGRLCGKVSLDAGQHDVLPASGPPAFVDEQNLILAHYYRRGPWQMVTKNVMGRLKVLAAGRSEIEQNRSSHRHAGQLLDSSPDLRDQVKRSAAVWTTVL